ncbi:MAG: glycosyltransferase [Pseudomonadota bacterium]
MQPRASRQESHAERADYFRAFEHVLPPPLPKLSRRRALTWQFLAAFTLGIGLWYLQWRWMHSLNPDALVFSAIVAAAETGMFIGTLLFFFDIWDEGDTPREPPPQTPEEACLPEDSDLSVDILIATYDEDMAVLEATLTDALAVRVPQGWRATIYLLDDGQRPLAAQLARRLGVRYLTRPSNAGFKAGNLRNALLRSDGSFIVICDADTRLFPGFLENTLGYFRARDVAWVQTPHWFYDIPEGRPWSVGLPAPVARLFALLGGTPNAGGDPFLSGSLVFFDVIQRRRNRNGASFCCGAGSIHRREPLFEEACAQNGPDRANIFDPSSRRGLRPFMARLAPLQPFRYHVSEDIFTSMLLHSSFERWRSVYHPQIESKMLSPWSMDAWAAQKLKYAGGTLDLMLRHNPLWRAGMPWRIKLHYAATFWSYLNAIILAVLLFAPIFTLLTGLAPIDAYSSTFFLHLLPLLFANEAALAVASKGHDANQGRVLSLATLPIVAQALAQALKGKKIKFRPTPKTPLFKGSLRFVWPHLALLALMAFALIYGVCQHVLGSVAHSGALLLVNAFWLAWCGWALTRAVKAALWRPERMSDRAAFLPRTPLPEIRKADHA